MVKRYAELYMEARKALAATEGENAGVVARELICRYSGKDAAQFLADREQFAPSEVEKQLQESVWRILAGEPLPYVLGEWDFYGMTLKVTRDTLIPRDDTMAVTDLAVETVRQMEQSPRVLDLCTGTGCIGLAIANQLPEAWVTLADVSPNALRVAKQNAAQFGPRVSCIQADALQPAPALLKNYDLLVSNPPYITNADMEALPDSVKNFEPDLALRGGADGLDFYRAIVQNFSAVLKPDGYICFEFGMGQAKDVCRILIAGGYQIQELRDDSRGITRAVIAQKKSEE